MPPLGHRSVPVGNASLTGATQHPLGSFSFSAPLPVDSHWDFCTEGTTGLSILLGNLQLYLSLFLWQLLITVRTTPWTKSIFSFSVEHWIEMSSNQAISASVFWVIWICAYLHEVCTQQPGFWRLPKAEASWSIHKGTGMHSAASFITFALMGLL